MFTVFKYLAIFEIIWVIARGVYLVVIGTEGELVQVIADDGYYYWIIARHLIDTGVSTFDGGITLTSGYHPLWAWFLLPFAALPISEILQLKVFVGFSVLITAITSILLLYIMIRNRWTFALAVYCLILGSYSWMTNSISGMEWPLVVLLNLITFLVVFHGQNKHISNLLLFAIGFSGSLARTDFGAVPGILFCVSIFVTRKSSGHDWLITKNLAWILGGAIAGLAGVFAYFYLMTGQGLQGSIAVKHLWGEHSSVRMQSAAFQFLRSFVYMTDFSHHINTWVHGHSLELALSVFTVFIIATILFSNHVIEFIHFLVRKYDDANAPIKIISISSILIIVFYFTLYALNGVEVQPWYTAHVTVPFIVLSAILVWALYLSKNAKNKIIFVLFMFIILNAVLNLRQPWAFPAQIYMRDAGYIFKEKFPDQRVGFSGSGAVSFFQGGTTINLDGLVNNEIYHYMPLRLPCYLRDKQIMIFDGFGVGEVLFSLTDKSNYSHSFIVTGKSGIPINLNTPDFVMINQLPECKK